MSHNTRQAVSPLKVVFAAVAVLAIVLAAYFLLTAPEDDAADGARTSVLPEIPVKRVKTTGRGDIEVLFPLTARCDNREVNLFVSHFLDILLEPDHKKYRLNVSRFRRPTARGFFEQARFRTLRIEVVGIEEVEDPSTIELEGLGQLAAPVYKLRSHVVLTDNTERNFESYVFKEEGKWVSSH